MGLASGPDMTHRLHTPLLLGFPEYRQPAQRLAYQAGFPYADIELHSFPDGESRICLPQTMPEQVILCRSLDHPNSKLIELLLAAATARRLGARHLTLVAPYLCYMRQDTAFHPGEAVSQIIIGDLLARHFDSLITVDPHLHRVSRLQQAVPVKRAITLHASATMARFLESWTDDPFLIGPDQESAQWVKAIAERRALQYAIAEKQRKSDQEVCITVPQGDYTGRNIVLVDDIASTGHTLEAAARQLAPYRPASISVLVTHALFVDDALSRLRAAGVARIFSTDSIVHTTNRLMLADLLAAAVRRSLANDQ